MKIFLIIKRKINVAFMNLKSKFIGEIIIEHRDSFVVFNEAIRLGLLSANESDENYAGNYMYMQTVNGVDRFKNINTRNYLRSKI